MNKKYIVDLTASERQELMALTQSGQISARKLKRAQMLLLADEGKPDAAIAAFLKVGLRTVERTRQRLVADRLVELQVVESISDETVRKLVKKTAGVIGKKEVGHSRCRGRLCLAHGRSARCLC